MSSVWYACLRVFYFASCVRCRCFCLFRGVILSVVLWFVFLGCSVFTSCFCLCFQCLFCCVLFLWNWFNRISASQRRIYSKFLSFSFKGRDAIADVSAWSFIFICFWSRKQNRIISIPDWEAIFFFLVLNTNLYKSRCRCNNYLKNYYFYHQLALQFEVPINLFCCMHVIFLDEFRFVIFICRLHSIPSLFWSRLSIKTQAPFNVSHFLIPLEL